MEKYSCGNVSATFHFAVSYSVAGEGRKTAVDYGTASLDIEREKMSFENGDFVTRLRITNTSGKALKLLSAYPILTDDLQIGDFSSSDWKVLNGSRQLDDVPASCVLGKRDYAFCQAVNRLSAEGMPIRDYTQGDAVLYGDGLTVIKAGKTFVCLEIITNDIQLTDISISSDCKGALKAIRLGGEFGSLIDDGETVYTDWVRVVVGGNFARLVDDYALRKNEMSCNVKSCENAGIYKITDIISPEQLSERLAFLRSLRAPFEYVEISGKWYSKVGDWEDASGVNISHLASLINKSGYRAGVHTMPFLVDKDSELFAFENKWLLRHGDGSYCTYEANGKMYGILDVSNSECLEWISMLYSRLSVQGYYLHHVDHTMSFVLQKDVVLSNPNVTISQAYKNAIKTIKEAIGEEGYLYASNAFAPMLCAIADAVQVCSDIDVLQKAESANVYAKLVNQCAHRAYSTLWWNNACGFEFSPDFSPKYSLAEKKFLLACEYITGSPLNAGDLTTNDHLKTLRVLYPKMELKIYPRDVFGDSTYVSVVDVEVCDSYHTVCFFNNSFTEVDLSFKLDSSLCGGYVDHASEYTVSSYFGRMHVYDCKYDNVIKLGTIPPNSCEIVKIVKNDVPSILLSDMHFSMGGEVKVSLKNSIVTVAGKNLFNCRGNYVISLPKDMRCLDGKREFSVTLNGAGEFSYEKPVKKVD